MLQVTRKAAAPAANTASVRFGPDVREPLHSAVLNGIPLELLRRWLEANFAPDKQLPYVRFGPRAKISYKSIATQKTQQHKHKYKQNESKKI